MCQGGGKEPSSVDGSVDGLPRTARIGSILEERQQNNRATITTYARRVHPHKIPRPDSERPPLRSIRRLCRCIPHLDEAVANRVRNLVRGAVLEGVVPHVEVQILQPIALAFPSALRGIDGGNDGGRSPAIGAV